MDLELTLLAIPTLALVVLGTLLATAGRQARSVYIGVLGLMGVVFGGPSTMLVLSASAADRSTAVVEDAGDSAAAPAATNEDKVKANADAATAGETAEKPATAPSHEKGQPAEQSEQEKSDNSTSNTPLHEPIMRESVRIWGETPDWVKLERVRGSELDRSVVSTDPYSTVQGCSDALDDALVNETNDYIDWHLHQPSGRASQLLDFDLDYINRHLVKERYHQELDVNLVGRMQRKYALLEFDQEFRDAVSRQWDDIRGSSRLLLAGLFGGSVLGLLGLLFSFFKLDNATRGFYTGRLQFATMAAILGLIAAGVLVARWIPWL